MGVKHLNQYLRRNCENSISQVSLKDLAGKKVTIDISIYLYRALADDSLLEGIFQLLSVLLEFDLVPIVVFDGKPPSEKKDVLDERREKRKKAQDKADELEKLIDVCEDEDELKELQYELSQAKKGTVRIKKSDVDEVKKLIMSMGVSYLEAEGEADVMCAKLVQKRYAWACISEDMDMFVYGCPRVIRYLSLLSKSGVLYEQESILSELGIDQNRFREICVLSGTDYGKDHPSIPISKSMALSNEYDMMAKKDQNGFLEWCSDKTKSIDNVYAVYSICYMFDLNLCQVPNYITPSRFVNGPLILDNIESILENEGFIFAKET